MGTEEPRTGKIEAVSVSDGAVVNSSSALVAVNDHSAPGDDGIELNEKMTRQESENTASNKASDRHTWQFYVIFTGLVLSGLLSALDGAIVSTALPTIVAELDIGADYVWVANIYFLTR